MHILTFTPDPVSQKLLARGSSQSSRTGATNIDSTEVLGLSEHWIKCQPPQWDLTWSSLTKGRPFIGALIVGGEPPL